MIQSLNTYSSPWLVVNHSQNKPYFPTSNLSAGMLRYNPSNNSVEVYDGSSWFTFSGHAEVNLSPEAQQIMNWAREKMREEEELKVLMNKHPGLRDLHEKFELMKALVAEDAQNRLD